MHIFSPLSFSSTVKIFVFTISTYCWTTLSITYVSCGELDCSTTGSVAKHSAPLWHTSIHSYSYHNIVLYYEALYWWPIRLLSHRHSSGVVRNPHSTLAEWGIFNLRAMSPQGTHLLIARRRNSINSVLVTISGMTCLIATCEPRTINLSMTGERITFTM